MEFNLIKFDKDPKQMSASQLAYVGDAFYELLVRTYLVQKYDYNVNELHKAAVKFVKAEEQAFLLKRMDSFLSEEEIRIYKRGRNAKITSIPKNASLKDYRYATGFEALLGYLYLNKNYKRVYELFDIIIDIKEESNGEFNENN